MEKKSKSLKNKSKKKTKKINIKNKSPKKSQKKTTYIAKNKRINKSNNKSLNKKSKSKSNKKKSKSKKKKKLTIIEQEESKINERKSTIKIISNKNLTKKSTTKIIIEPPTPPPKPKKIFIESKVGTPHFDLTKYLKIDIVQKEKLIKKSYNIKDIYANELKRILEKIENTLTDFRQTPEQINRIRLLYFILKINKKNNNDSLLKNKSLKEEYNILLNKNNYNPIDKINQFREKIDMSKSENMDMLNQINKLKFNNIKKRNKLKLFALNDKYNFDINNLSNELNLLNNDKQKALNRLKNNKKVINSILIKFKNIIQSYESNKNNIKKVDKDINMLKKDLNGDEEEIYNKIINNRMLIMKEISYNYKIKKDDCNSLKINKNNSYKKENKESIDKINIQNIKNLKRSESAQIIQKDKNNNKKNIISLRARFFNLSELPLINSNQNNKIINFNNNNIINNNNYFSLNIIKNDKEKSNLEDLNISQIKDMDYNEINNKKEHYNNIIKKLDYSIKEVENMYKRKIVQMQEELYEKIKEIDKLDNTNNIIKKEIENLTKILNLQKSYDLYDKENKINELKKKYEKIKIKEDNIAKDKLNSGE